MNDPNQHIYMPPTERERASAAALDGFYTKILKRKLPQDIRVLALLARKSPELRTKAAGVIQIRGACDIRGDGTLRDRVAVDVANDCQMVIVDLIEDLSK